VINYSFEDGCDESRQFSMLDRQYKLTRREQKHLCLPMVLKLNCRAQQPASTQGIDGTQWERLGR